MIYVPDTSVIVDGRFTLFLEDQKNCTVILPEAMLAEIEHQANEGRSLGFAGLEELKKLRAMAEKGIISLDFYGSRPSRTHIKGAGEGEIDELIMTVALENDAILVTGDQIQRDISEIKGIKTKYLEHPKKSVRNIEEFFGNLTTSIHLKGNCRPILKEGVPGSVTSRTLDLIITENEIESIASNVVKRARMEENSYIESDLNGATVVQLHDMRVVVTRPPFSDAVEITAVKPIRKLSIDEYSLDDTLKQRILSRSSGVLIAGSPGAGKSTLVQALAEWISSMGRIVKTMENPRDLQLSREITQYTSLEGSMENTGNIMLLLRTDYTVFDEMRVTSDFHVYVDLRLAGIGMIGVVHATRAIDAIQRFIGRVELGLIPQVIDTIMFVDAGQVKSVLITESTVRVPHGMNQDDLARPVIVVSDYFTHEEKYEIYSFGEQIFAVPLDSTKKRESVIQRYAKESILHDIRNMTGIKDITLKEMDEGRIVIQCPEDLISRIIGRGGSNIVELEKKIGMHIEVEPSKGENARGVPGIDIRNRIVYLDIGIPNAQAKIFVDGVLILQAKTSSRGIIRARTSTETGAAIFNAIKENRRIEYSVDGSDGE